MPQNNIRVSVVITTIGEKMLDNVTVALNSGTYIPHEIILCIPFDMADKIAHLASNNIRILATECKGQVKQRIEGFKQAANELVLQLDSDVVFDPDCLEILIASILEKGKKAAVAPIYQYDTPGSSYSPHVEKNNVIKKILNYIVNGKNFNKVNRNISQTWDTWFFNYVRPNKFEEVNFMAGGCVLHYKKNLILNDYYPFNGKAFDEDVIHSILLQRKGITLYCQPAAVTHVINEGEEYDFNTFNELVRYFKRIYRTKMYIVKLAGGSELKFYFWFNYFLLTKSISFSIKKIRSTFQIRGK